MKSTGVTNTGEERKQGDEQTNRISEEAIKYDLLDDEEYNIVHTMYTTNKTILKHTPGVTVLPEKRKRKARKIIANLRDTMN